MPLFSMLGREVARSDRAHRHDRAILVRANLQVFELPSSSMASSLSLEEKFEQLLKLNAEKDAQLEYLRKQLD